jgi:hypothetical protein
MKTNIIFTCAMLCTSLGILSMEPDKAVHRRKRTANKSVKPSQSLSDPYRDYILYTSRNELVPEEVIKKLGRQTGQAARKHNKLVHCNIDGCSFINDRPAKPAFKREPTKLVSTDVQFPQKPSNHEYRSHGSQTDCQVVINIPSGKLTSREFYLDEYSPLQKIESPVGKRYCCVTL